MRDKEELMKIFAVSLKEILRKADFSVDKLQEIRLRVGNPLILIYEGSEYFMTDRGEITKSREQAYVVSKREVRETMEYVGNYSLYAFEDEVKQGFLTIQGGHRIGVAGKTVIEGNGIKSMKYISFVNIRLSHEIKGCADKVMPYITEHKEVLHTLIISPPRCGKTTLLRDMVRQISEGNCYCLGSTVGVVDERSEIGGCYLGIPQNDLGPRTDVLDCCPKGEGMMMLIRSMSPQVVVADEIGDYEDVHAIESVIHCGCKLIATVHGSSIEDIQKKPLLKKLVNEAVFQRYIILGNGRDIGEVRGIFNGARIPVSKRGQRI